MAREIEGRNPVRVRNPNDFAVRVGLRTERGGKDFDIAANGAHTVYVPNGSYRIYFWYASDPQGLYQGDDFALNNGGVEIHLVRVVNGNYGIRRVK